MLSWLLPAGGAWAAAGEAAAATLGGLGEHTGSQAATALFVCSTEEGCETAVVEAGRAISGGRGCLLVLDCASLASPQQLQADLAVFLREVPAGVVVLNRLDQASPDLLPVLVDALSGEGRVQPEGGAAVSTAGATFLLTSHMPMEVLQNVDDAPRFSQDVLQHLAADLAARAGDQVDMGAQAEALQQRIDHVLPVGSEPDEYDAWSTGRQAGQAGQQQEGSGEDFEGQEWEEQPWEEAAEPDAELPEYAGQEEDGEAAPADAQEGEWLAEGSGAGGPARGDDSAYSEQTDPLAEAVLQQ